MSFNLNDLTAYVDEQREPLIGKAVRSAKSAKMLTLQTGVKGKAALNLLNSTTVFGDGSSCGWTPSGTTKLSQRKISTGAVKINVPFCDKDLLGYWAGYDVKVAAGEKTLPFAEDFIQGQLDGIASAMETAIWQGDTDSESANLNKFDGLIKIIDATSGATEGNISSATGITTTNVIDLVDDMFATIPAELIDKDNVVIFAGSDTFRKYVLALKKANMYHYSYDADAGLELVIPGTSIKLVAVNGLNATNRMFAMQLTNVFYGTDLESDTETFKFWYSEDNSEFRLKVEFVAGVQVAFPDEIVEFTLA